VVDLSNAAAPRIAGALEMAGFAEYLHPLGNGLLLGLGKDAVPVDGPADGQFAWYQGMRLVLYDASDPAAHREHRRGPSASAEAIRSRCATTMPSRTLKIGNSTIVPFPRGSIRRRHVSDPSYYYPWQSSGCMRYEVRAGTTAAAAAIYTLDT
jgi:hypothetical protein